MNQKLLELKLELLYEKTMRLDLLNHLEWKDSRDMCFEEIQKDILVLYYLFKEEKSNVVELTKTN